jgi:endonuclease-3
MASKTPAPRGARRKARDLTSAPIAELIDRLDRAYPEARLALDFDSPLQLLVALILAAQCTDAKVNEITPGLCRRFPSAAAFAAASQEELERWVRPTGFFRQKARALRNCCSTLVERFAGEVPTDLDALLSLPGVGRKTANILRGNAFGIPGIGVDTHVGRLAQRLGLSANHDPDRIEADLALAVPAAQQIRFCHLLQQHGRTVCQARKPRCTLCVLDDICPFPGKTKIKPRKRPPARSRWIR